VLGPPRIVLPAKLQGETLRVNFPFGNKLETGEAVASAVTTCAVWSGVDANPSSVISGAAAVPADGLSVYQTITAGIAGVIYYLLCTATTNSGRVLQCSAYLTVLPTPVP
jgi:hypothetical protein